MYLSDGGSNWDWVMDIPGSSVSRLWVLFINVDRRFVFLSSTIDDNFLALIDIVSSFSWADECAASEILGAIWSLGDNFSTSFLTKILPLGDCCFVVIEAWSTGVFSVLLSRLLLISEKLNSAF